MRIAVALGCILLVLAAALVAVGPVLRATASDAIAETASAAEEQSSGERLSGNPESGGFGEGADLGASAAAIPEPATFALLGLGVLGLVLRQRR